MLIFNTIANLQHYLATNNFSSIGFVPTMGALHQGHLSLVETAINKNELTVCSIFVNPTQFNKQEDLINYPRNVDDDIQLLEKIVVKNNVVLFLPSEDEIYPEKNSKTYSFDALSEVMEAKFRPGHFNGVAMVIERFFEIIKPTNAYFGEKDFQQLAVVKLLTKQLKLPINIVGCSIVREKNGLAMSSRNQRLSVDEREMASIIFQLLNYAKENVFKQAIAEIKTYVSVQLKKTKRIELEYFEIADGNTLKQISSWEESDYLVAFIAVTIGNVRLIDNMTL